MKDESTSEQFNIKLFIEKTRGIYIRAIENGLKPDILVSVTEVLPSPKERTNRIKILNV